MTLTIEWGDGTSEEILSEYIPPDTDPYHASFDFTHVYADNGTYTVQICANDGEDTTCDSREITVDNVAPTVSNIDQVIYEGDDLTVAFNDLGTLDTHHIASVDWGDGSPPVTAVASEIPFGPPGSKEGLDGTVTSSWHELPPGVYAVTACVTDDDGAESCASLNVTIVHGFLRFCAYGDDEKTGITVHQDAVATCALVPSGIPGDTRPSGIGSRGEVDIKDRADITGVLLSLNDKIDVGKDVSVAGTLTAGHDVKVDQRSHIDGNIVSGHKVELKREVSVSGDITAADEVKVDSRAEVTGTRTDFASVPPIPAITFVQFSFEPGTER